MIHAAYFVSNFVAMATGVNSQIPTTLLLGARILMIFPDDGNSGWSWRNLSDSIQ